MTILFIVLMFECVTVSVICLVCPLQPMAIKRARNAKKNLLVFILLFIAYCSLFQLFIDIFPVYSQNAKIRTISHTIVAQIAAIISLFQYPVFAG